MFYEDVLHGPQRHGLDSPAAPMVFQDLPRPNHGGAGGVERPRRDPGPRRLGAVVMAEGQLADPEMVLNLSVTRPAAGKPG